MTAEMTKMPEPIRAFAELANSEGCDIAYTYDTERSRWVFLNPMTADLWRYWQEASRLAMERCAEVCDVTPPYPFRPSIEAAHAIRALADVDAKEKGN